MSSPFNARDLVEGPVRLYVAKNKLDPTAPVPPANTVAFGGAWPAGWRSLGYSSRDPINFGGLSGDRTPVYSGQQRGQIASFMGEITETVALKILTRTFDNIRQLANRGILSTIAAGSGTPGEYRIVWSDQVNEQVALGIEGYGAQGRIFRAYYPIGSFAITDNLPYGFGADNAAAGITATFTAEGGPDNVPNWWEVIPALP